MIASQFRSYGVTPIIASQFRPAKPSQTLSEKIQNLILQSHCFLAILTRNGLNPTFVQQEIGFTLGRKRAVIPFVIDALIHAKLKAQKPLSKSGKKKVVGYPDIYIEDKYGRSIYVDCKTYNTKTKHQTFRTFYFSPSKDPKITRDAFHLLLSFELDTAERKGKRAFIPISWQIYTLDKLLIQVKHEFNASNKDLYTPQALLAQGKIRQ